MSPTINSAPRPSGGLIWDEDGVSYTLPFVLLLPLYLFIVLCILQASLIMLARVGLAYAAHAGARSAVVWQSAQPAGQCDARVRQAVFTALAPFTGSGAAPGKPKPISRAVETGADEYADAFLAYSAPAGGSPLAEVLGLPRATGREGLRRRYLAAAQRTRVEVSPEGARSDEEITVTVRYRFRLLVPVVARWFAQGGDTREYTIAATATLPSEAPASGDGTLGIPYQSR